MLSFASAHFPCHENLHAEQVSSMRYPFSALLNLHPVKAPFLSLGICGTEKTRIESINRHSLLS
ncbi:hypothetical protein BT93_B1800 [Corymbia citriodora subsp. variegata]|nr:hypothetical protein BT93_B1800 [Corymbia citriodora subsp. variegata]